MAWYHGTYSCGHEGRINLIGPTKDREWKKEREFSGLCPECYKKKLEAQRKAENEASEKISKEMELPELSGSPKQVAWANTLRVKFLESFSDLINQTRNSKEKSFQFSSDGKRTIVSLSEAETMEDLFIRKADARFWIDRRNYTIVSFVKEAYGELQEKENPIPEDVAEEMMQEEAALTVEPETKVKEGIVNISIEEGYIKAKYIKDDDFREIVKSLGYSWEGVWCKKITEYSGSERDRIAELGNKLLANGFSVHFPKTDSRDMAISGEFTPECTKWVKYNITRSMLNISWKERSDEIYQAAKKLSGARWHQGAMLVPIEFYNEVLDFADTMGFCISKRAENEIQSFQKEASRFIKKDVKEAVFKEKNGMDELRKQLEKSGLIEDLKDEA